MEGGKGSKGKRGGRVVLNMVVMEEEEENISAYRDKKEKRGK